MNAAPILVGTLVLLLGMTTSTNVFADCGGYVIIGNKAKLRELQKEGFSFGSTMKSHRLNASQSPHSNSGRADKRSSIWRKQPPLLVLNASFEPDFGFAEVVEERPSNSHPCSGPNCRSKSRPTPQPVSLSIESSPPKPLKTAAVSYEKRADDSYFGRSEYSESPILYKLLIDRPPQ